MKVYVVAYGIYNEGTDFRTTEVFTDKKKAEAYQDAFCDNDYDYATTLVREVNQ